MITPRPYQDKAGFEIQRLEAGGVLRQLLSMATGTGKTNCAAFLPRYLPHRTKQILFLVHRKELVFQAAERFHRVSGGLVGVEMGQHRAWSSSDVVVASVQTLGRKGSRRLGKFKPTVVVVDEAHHMRLGSQYETVLKHYGCMDGQTPVLGLSATPNRHDGLGLHHFLDDIVPNNEVEPAERGWDLRWAIKQGWLCEINNHVVETQTDISSVKTQGGDFQRGGLSKAVNTQERNEQIVKEYREKGSGKGLGFAASIEHAIDLAETFKAYGIKSYAIHSTNQDYEMEDWQRDRIVRNFRKAGLEDDVVLFNVGIATEGFDVPDIRQVLMARPTRSAPLYTQMLGRLTRLVFNPTQQTADERKKAILASRKPFGILIDFVDLTGRHAGSLKTAPALFGLDPKFDTEEKKLIEAVEYVEALQKEHPMKPLMQVRSLSDVETASKRVSIWDIAEPDENLMAKSDLQWIQMEPGRFHLHIPCSIDSDRQDQVIEIESDRLGRYHTKLRFLRRFHKGRLVAQESERAGKIVYNDLGEALRGCDAYVYRDHERLMNLLRTKQQWRDQPATPAQMNFLHRLRVYIPEGTTITKGKASRLIEVAKQQRRR